MTASDSPVGKRAYGSVHTHLFSCPEGTRLGEANVHNRRCLSRRVRYLRIRKLPHIPARRAALRNSIFEKVSLIYGDSIFYHESAEFISKTLFFVMFLLILDVLDDAFFCLQSIREGSIALCPAAEGREMWILLQPFI